jgi:hypothetical protein
MYQFLAGATVVAVVAVASYFERKVLRADVVKIKTDFEGAGEKFLLTLRSKESQIRAKIANDVAKVFAEVSSAVSQGDATSKADVLRIVEKLESDLRKVI